MERINPEKHKLNFSPEDSLSLNDEGSEILHFAKTGDLQAIRNLGCTYIWGENGFPKDEERARSWYMIAAMHGHDQAMWDVATMLVSGEGGPKDIKNGLLFLSKLANKKRFTVYGTSASEYLIEIYSGKVVDHIGRDEEQIHHLQERLKAHRRYYRGWNRKCR